ncbi:MAG: PAS domain-containing sensor histidine kinase [Desulfuromonas sp.]|nr:MAG: PAS domain-containing sensor histidine kinase [Desulfuromonas sp.]
MAAPPPSYEPPEHEQRKRRREWLAIALTTLLVLILSHFETQFFALAARFPLSNSILALLLINVNILLILFILFLVFRNLFKLLLERRRNVPGARLRSKLVLAFVALSLIPTMLLFFAASGFITSSIESWFNDQIENSLQESLDVAQTYYKNSAENALYYGEQLALVIKDEKLLNEANLPLLRALVETKQQEYNLGVVEVFSATHEELVRSTNPQIPTTEFSDPDSDLIREALQGGRFSRITPIGKADLIRGVVPIRSNWNEADVVGVVVINYYVPYSLVSKMKEISSSFEQFKQTKQLKGKIKKGYVIILLLIALIIIFLATWFGFHLARGITEPIQELAIATSRVAEGDLEVRLEPRSDDEVGALVHAFNSMTTDLQRAHGSLEEANLQLQQANIESEQRRRYMEIVLRNVTAGVIALDRQGNLTTINVSAEQLLKIDTDQVLGKNFRNVVSSEHLPLIKDLLRELIQSGQSTLRRQITLTIKESKLTLLVTVTTLQDEEGEFMGTVVVFDDLTQLIKAQRMAAWREVARRIAHEIKNPLTPIQLSAQRLRRRYLERFREDDTVFDECTTMVIRQVDELKNLVNEFSNFARMPAANPAPCDLNPVVNEALQLYEEGHPDLTFAFQADPQLPTFSFDRDQIKRVLINLLDNAVAAVTEEGGHIEIGSRFDPELKMVSLSIADNGCGISSEDRPRLFEPYFSTKKSGTGLGLAIVATIINDHHGYIRVKENSPRGTVFVIELPTGEEKTTS